MIIPRFQKLIWEYYHENKRDLPWRHTTDPYRIVVSEVMLQQTQVNRVKAKYAEFLKQFPTVSKLAKASLKDVLAAWSGLGYNRRARFLWQATRTIMQEYRGRFPRSQEVLTKLPGIGWNTAGAIMAYAYNEPVAFIETNVRTVYLHYFFPEQEQVSDKELLSLVEQTVDHKNPREWYWAIMDYGAMLKRTHGNPNHRSRHHRVQSKFEGSNRQVRGAILKALLNGPLTQAKLDKQLKFDQQRLIQALTTLITEGMITKTSNQYHIT